MKLVRMVDVSIERIVALFEGDAPATVGAAGDDGGVELIADPIGNVDRIRQRRAGIGIGENVEELAADMGNAIAVGVVSPRGCRRTRRCCRRSPDAPGCPAGWSAHH